MRRGGLGPLCLAPRAPEDSGNVLGWGPARGWRWASKMEGGAGLLGDVWVHPRPGLGERPPGACGPRAPRGLVSPAGPGRAPSSRAGRVGALWWPGAGLGLPHGGRGSWVSLSVALPPTGSLGCSVQWVLRGCVRSWGRWPWAGPLPGSRWALGHERVPSSTLETFLFGTLQALVSV